jgi:S1-C subfamily serine protease
MNRLFPAFPAFLAAAITLPACCAYQGARHPSPSLTDGERIQQQTVALVGWAKLSDDGETVVEAEAHEENARVMSYCAGVWINRDTFITAYHCIEDLNRTTVTLELDASTLTPQLSPVQGPLGAQALYSAFGDVNETALNKAVKTHSSYVFAIDKQHDLALMRATTDPTDPTVPHHPSAAVATSAHVGDQVSVVGHPHGMWWSYVHGYVGAIRPDVSGPHGDVANVLQVSAPVWYGDSGGGAFDAQGNLIGVCSFLNESIPNMAFFIRFDHVNDLVKRSGIAH